MSINEDHSVVRINLMDQEETHAAESIHGGAAVAFEGMSVARLKRNYEALQRAQAIYYPVAFQFLRELGRGRQGTVYLGVRQGARGCLTEHAIKLYDPSLYRTAEEYWTDMGRIASQISRLQRIQSPHVVSRHSYEETHGIGYVQMDAVDGTDLRQFLNWEHMEMAHVRCSDEEWAHFTDTIFHVEGRQISLQPGVAIYIIRGLLRGLERLHELNFLHLDVKPGNIMIDRLGTVKVVDFGRAVVIGEELSFLLGSPSYMAPETHRRQSVDARSDLYSVGLVAMELVRGQPLAPNGISEDDLLDLKLGLRDRMFDLLPPHVQVNSDFVDVLRKLLEPDANERFLNTKEADVGGEGLARIDKQLVQAGLDSEYARDLSGYLSKLVDARTQRVETEEAAPAISNESAVYERPDA